MLDPVHHESAVALGQGATAVFDFNDHEKIAATAEAPAVATTFAFEGGNGRTRGRDMLCKPWTLPGSGYAFDDCRE